MDPLRCHLPIHDMFIPEDATSLRNSFRKVKRTLLSKVGISAGAEEPFKLVL
ncbi:MAG: hypothetical protein QXM43_00125 [Desulfurococcaceae archaeon]